MNQRFQPHIRSFIAAGAFVGCFLGALTGLAVMRWEQHDEASQLAASYIARADEVSTETVRVLGAINASANEACSDADLAHLRELVVTSHFLKSAGRVERRRLICSSTLGRLAAPAEVPEPDFVTDRGRSILLAAEMTGIPGVKGMVVEEGSASVVLSPRAHAALADPRLDYIYLAEYGGQRRVLSSSIMEPQLPAGPLDSGSSVQVAGQRFEIQCSADHTGCILARFHTAQAPLLSPIFMGFAILGLMAGGGAALGLRTAAERARSLDRRLRTALRAGTLTLAYQPIVLLADNSRVGAEALLRWKDEQGRPIPPDLFIAAAEEGGFMPDVTRYVLRRVLSELGPELRQMPDFHVAVNISVQDLLDDSFPDFVASALAFMRVPPQNISFEVTERSTANHASLSAGIQRLRQAGHQVYIDDFGTGYSSLAYLGGLHVDVLKIDRSFTQSVGTDNKAAAITTQIVAMAASLQLKLVVEGVETEEQAAYFRQLEPGCMAQGWLFGRPVPASALFSEAG